MPRLSRVVRGSGPGLLLAHGGGGGIEPNFGPIIDGLAEGRTVVGPDFPGSGDTPRATAPLTLDGLADQLVLTAVEEGVERFAILGYSMGGPVAIRAAIRHPHRVTALVLTASFAAPNPRIRLATSLWRGLIDSGDDQRIAAFLALIGLGAPFLDGFTEDRLQATLETIAARLRPGTRDHLDLVDGIDVRGDLPRIAVPTLVISTTADALATPHHHRRLADAIPDAAFAELPSGHLPAVERPAEWLALIRDFLDGIALDPDHDVAFAE
ncbi:alpha/beta fold hydrolase [Actinomadura nitritigenes]|uniref:alpha/beta fold hydrolase n=1 Tax=Actinomadura nitritigenes TaxID=134602 RepID=UPI003D8EAE89